MGQDVLTLLAMVIQFGINFLVGKLGPDKAKKWIPIVTTVTSLIYNAGLAFTHAANGPPTGIISSIAPTVYLAGFFGSFGNLFLDVLKDTFLQTFLVVGSHSATKNTVQAFKKP